MTGTILFMCGTAITTAVSEKILNAFGKMDMAQYVNVAGLSLVAVAALKLVGDTIGTCKRIFG